MSAGSWPTDGWGWVSRQLAVGVRGPRVILAQLVGGSRYPNRWLWGFGGTRSGDSLGLADMSPLLTGWSVCVCVCARACVTLCDSFGQ